MVLLKTLFIGWGVGFVAAIPAGPVGASVFAQGIEGRRRSTAPAMILGAIVVDAVYCALAFLGVSIYLKPWLANPIVGAIAMIFLLGLGYKMATTVPIMDGGGPNVDRAGGTGSETSRGAFCTGFFMSVANPILPVSWAGIVYALQSSGTVGEEMPVLITFAIFAALGMGCWLLVLYRTARFGRSFLSPKAVRWVIRGLGIMVMLMGVYYGVWTVIN